MTNTHIDKEAREAILMIAKALDHQYGSIMEDKMRRLFTPLPAEGESSPKPEAELWRDRVKILSSIADEQTCGCCERIVRTARKWFAESKPEAGEPKVIPPVPYDQHEREMLEVIQERDEAEEALSQVFYLVTGNSPQWSNLFGHQEAIDEIADAVALLKQAAKPDPTTQPAEPKVMPLVTDDDDTPNPFGLIGSNTAVSIPKVHPPQPSEQANGAEWLPVTMRTASAFSFALAGLGDARRLAEVQDRDTQWRSFIESERSQHKAEMEAVKKGASR